jgi:hypothetical protein
MKIGLTAEQGLVVALLSATLILAVAVPDAPKQAVSNSSVFIGILVVLAILFLAGLPLQPKNAREEWNTFIL